MRLHSALIAVLTHLVGKLKGVALRNSQVGQNLKNKISKIIIVSLIVPAQCAHCFAHTLGGQDQGCGAQELTGVAQAIKKKKTIIILSLIVPGGGAEFTGYAVGS